MTESVSNSEEIEVDDEVPEDVPTDEAGDGPQSSESKRIPDAGVEAPADEDPEQADTRANVEVGVVDGERVQIIEGLSIGDKVSLQ